MYVRHRLSLLGSVLRVRRYLLIGSFVDLCPGLQNLILCSARSATTYNSLLSNHSKNDNPSWTYVGTSYRVSLSTGVALLPGLYDNLLSYSYYETGYDVESSRSYNSTSAFNLSLVSRNFQLANRSDVELNIWVASGVPPNSDLGADYITFLMLQSK